MFDDETKIVATLNVLGSRNIHGFSVNPGNNDELIVFGERFLKKLTITELKANNVSSQPPFYAGDRVMDVHWISGNEIAVLLAHNVVLTVDLALNYKTTGTQVGSENSVLFSGSIVRLPKNDDLLVLGGACLGSLYLWKPFSKLSPKETCVNLSSTGGIFDCCFHKNSLAIACEDRAIYLFDFDSVKLTVERKNKLYGHSARIWKIRFSNDQLVSVGEDNLVLLWNTERGEVVHRFETVSNASFFALAIDPSNPQRIVTGLGDGSIRLYYAPQERLNDKNAVGIPGDEPGVTLRSITEHVVSFKFIDSSNGVFITNTGKLCSISLSGEESVAILAEDKHFSIAVVLAVRMQGRSCHIAMAHGVPSVLSFFTLNQNSEGKWTDCKKIEEFSPNVPNFPRFYLLGWIENFHNGLDHSVFVSNFDVAENAVFSSTTSKPLLNFNLAKIEKPLTNQLKHFDKIAVRCAVRLSDSKFIFGDNCGSVFTMEQNDKIDVIFPHVHGRDGCEQFCLDGSLLYSCGGSGSMSIFKIDDENNVKFISTIKPCGSLDYTVSTFQGDDGQQFVCGFAQKSFMVSMIRPNHVTLSKHYCSGRNRNWDVNIGEMVKFAYIRQGNVCLVEISKNHKKELELKPSLHGLRIHDCKFVCKLMNGWSVYVMSSEDSTSSIVAVSNDPTKTYQQLHRLAGHISGVRCCHVVPAGSSDGFLIFTGGSRGMAMVWSFEIPNISILDGIEKVKQNSKCRKLAQISLTNEPIGPQDLSAGLVEDVGGKKAKGIWRQRKLLGPPLAPDMRFMDLTSCKTNGQDDLIQIFAACSDATVRCFEFSTSDHSINQKLVLSDGLSYCQLKIITVKDDTGRAILLSGDTGGNINVWTFDNHFSTNLQGPQSFRIHQSGINAIHVAKAQMVIDNGDGLVIFTGGDDTAVSVSHLETSHLKCSILKKIESAHSSQVSGTISLLSLLFVSFLSKNTGIHYLPELQMICSSSIDQRIRFWKLADGQMTGGYATCVADMSALSVVRFENNILQLFVVGEGFQQVQVEVIEC